MYSHNANDASVLWNLYNTSLDVRISNRSNGSSNVYGFNGNTMMDLDYCHVCEIDAVESDMFENHPREAIADRLTLHTKRPLIDLLRERLKYVITPDKMICQGCLDLLNKVDLMQLQANSNAEVHIILGSGASKREMGIRRRRGHMHGSISRTVTNRRSAAASMARGRPRGRPPSKRRAECARAGPSAARAAASGNNSSENVALSESEVIDAAPSSDTFANVSSNSTEDVFSSEIDVVVIDADAPIDVNKMSGCVRSSDKNILVINASPIDSDSDCHGSKRLRDVHEDSNRKKAKLFDDSGGEENYFQSSSSSNSILKPSGDSILHSSNDSIFHCSSISILQSTIEDESGSRIELECESQPYISITDHSHRTIQINCSDDQLDDSEPFVTIKSEIIDIPLSSDLPSICTSINAQINVPSPDHSSLINNSVPSVTTSVEVIKTEISDEPLLENNGNISTVTEKIITMDAVHFINADSISQSAAAGEVESKEEVEKSACFLKESFITVNGEGEVCFKAAPVSGDHKCPCCPRSFVSAKGLHKHHVAMHVKTKQVACQMCQHVASSDRTIETHMREVHDKTVTVFCPLCDKDFILQTSLDQHIKYHHKMKNSSSKLYNLSGSAKKESCICPVCDAVLPDRKALSIHNSTKHEGQKYRCKFCSYQTFSCVSLKRHDAAIHKKNNYIIRSCLLCEETFNSLLLLEDHCLTVHSMLKKHRCSACGEYFATLDMLTAHKKTHKAYNCSFCDLGFQKQDNLKAHMVTVHNHDEPGLIIETVRSIAGPPDNKTFLSMPSLIDCTPASETNTADATVHSPSKTIVTSEPSNLQHFILAATSDESSPNETPSTKEIVIGNGCLSSKSIQNYDQALAEEFLKKCRHFSSTEKMECVFCNKKVSVGHLRAHFRTHAGDACFRCNYCEHADYQSTNLRKHIRNRHPQEYQNHHLNLNRKKKQFKCEFCEVVKNDIDTLEEHLWGHMTEKKFTCTICNRKFGMEQTHKEHRKTHYFDDRQTCHHCLRKFSSIGYFEEHVEKCVNNWKCSVCSMLCQNESTYRKHIKFAHPTETTNKFICLDEGCGKVFYEKHRYNDHVVTHNSERTFHCRQCPKKFKRARPLNEHIATKHQNLQCQDCNTTCLTLDHLLAHRKKSHLLHKCSICAFIFYNDEALKNHISSVHPADDSFKILSLDDGNDIFVSEADMKRNCANEVCSVYQCYQSFIDQKDATKHMVECHPDIRYMCALCQNEHYTESHLEEHMAAVHTSPSTCNQCHMKFYSKDYLIRHTELHSNDQQYMCYMCDFYTPNKHWIISHIKYTHTEKIKKSEIKDSLIKQRIYTCTACGDKFCTDDEANAHIAEHASSDIDAAADCTMQFIKLSDCEVGDEPLKMPSNCPCCGADWPNVQAIQNHFVESEQCATALQLDESSTNNEAEDEQPMQYHLVVGDEEQQDNIVLSVHGDNPVLVPLTGESGRNGLVLRMDGSDENQQIYMYERHGGTEIVVGSKDGVRVMQEADIIETNNAVHAVEHSLAIANGTQSLEMLLGGAIPDKMDAAEIVISDQLAALLNNAGQIILTENQ
uniref:Zinc finger protein 729-like n=1 Tax=Hirondellea gigas TaxID=1518452 RepID=A0A2P2I369_9CRUS